jgi:hypothetical protein
MELVKAISFSYLADKDERSPEIGVGVLLAELLHGGL